jgi:mono/diheme cytochrome c family protein
MDRALVVSALLFLVACDDKVAGGSTDGAAIFKEVCARCHGATGEPNPNMVARLGVKPLTSAHVREELSDEQIRAQILKGSANRQMPAFQGALSDAQVTAVVQYVRLLGSLQDKPEPAPSQSR